MKKSRSFVLLLMNVLPSHQLCLIGAAMLLFLSACNRPLVPFAAENGVDSIWADSAYQRAKKAEFYYNNNLKDSLFKQVAEDMAFDKEHQQWNWYYYSWMLLVNKCTFSGDVKRALEESNLMHSDATERNNAYGLALAKYAMALVYACQENYEEATIGFEEALRRYPKDCDPSVLFVIYYYYSSTLEEKHDMKSNEEVLTLWKATLDKTFQESDKYDDTKALWLYQYYKALFGFHFSQQDLAQATDDLDSMQYYVEHSGNTVFGVAYVTSSRSKLALASKDYATAIAYNNKEYAESKKLGPTIYMKAVERRAEILEAMGMYREALKLRNEFDRLKDSLNQADSQHELNEMAKRYELDELRTQQEKEKDALKQRQMNFIKAFAAILFFIMLVVSIIRHRSRLRLAQEHQKLTDAYKQLTIANEKAEESSKMKTMFIKQMSHEIRTPLNILSGFTQVLTSTDVELDEETRAEVNERITKNTARITELVNKMLELSDANSTSVIEKNDTITVEQIIISAVESVGMSSYKMIDFRTEIAPEANNKTLLTNYDQSVRALSLILANARKFLQKPTGEANGQSIGKIRLKAGLQADNLIAFAVEDSGIGVPPSEAEHIFEEFVQLDSYYEGMGIGLTVARSIARRLGGDITLDTTFTGGARFIMTLPLS
ncbi:sensor histidine kinase [Xylanibacter brevis]|uniref:sensor histidine kinase n=1 Tax=Xylanibacter brevis TaxID=83231 RepID=UPI000488C64F|nr:HAMP domain-containing sensor histidine kinase [Xylanibacter brevis]